MEAGVTQPAGPVLAGFVLLPPNTWPKGKVCRGLQFECTVHRREKHGSGMWGSWPRVLKSRSKER